MSKAAPIRILSVFIKQILPGYRLYTDAFIEYGEKTYLFLSAPATGDAYIYGLLLRPYLDKIHFNGVAVFGVFGKSSISIARLFAIQHSVGYTLEQFKMLYNLELFDQKNMVRIKSLHYHVFYRHIAFFTYMEGIHGFNIFSLAEAVLDIDHMNNLQQNMPHFEAYTYESVSVCANMDIPNQKVIIISPYAKSVRLLPESFWTRLVNTLAAYNFSVYTNSVGEKEPPVIGTKAIFIPYICLVPFLNETGGVISLRSGFSDVSNSAVCPKITLYPRDNYKRSRICSTEQSFALSDMYHQADQYDFTYSPENETELIQNIVFKIVSYQKTKEGILYGNKSTGSQGLETNCQPN